MEEKNFNKILLKLFFPTFLKIYYFAPKCEMIDATDFFINKRSFPLKTRKNLFLRVFLILKFAIQIFRYFQLKIKKTLPQKIHVIMESSLSLDQVTRRKISLINRKFPSYILFTFELFDLSRSLYTKA